MLMTSAKWILGVGFGAVFCLVFLPVYLQNSARHARFEAAFIAASEWGAGPRDMIQAEGGGIDATASHLNACQAGLGQRKGRTFVAESQPGPDFRQDFYAGACAGRHAMMVRIAPNAEAVVLTWDDAVELNLKPNHLTFDLLVDAGKGPQKAAKITIPVLRIGGVEITNVDARVVRDFELDTTVVGQTFLSRLKTARLTKLGNFVMAKD